MSTKRNPSVLGYVEDLWFDKGGQPKARNGKGRRYRARWVDEDGRGRNPAFATKKEAEAHLRQVARGEYASTTGKLTFKEFHAVWSAAQVWVPGTVQKSNRVANMVPFGDVRLDRLRPLDIQRWVKAMVDRPLAPNTISGYVDQVRSVIRAAVRDRIIPFDVTANVTLPRARKDEATMTIPTTAQVGGVIHHAPEGFAAFVAVCAFGGLRLGEAGGLRVSDIDFMRREIRVERQVQRVNGGGVNICPPKYGSERTIYAHEDLVNILAEHVRLHVPGDDPDRWMFVNRDGVPLHQNSAGYLWKTTREAAGVGFRLHDLRHFYASGLIHALCDPVTVQRAMGHASPSFTLNKYSHLWPKAEDRTRNGAAQMLSEALTAAQTAAQLRPKAQ